MECKKCGKVSDDETVFATFKDRQGIVRRRGICWECRGKRAYDDFERLQLWRKKYNSTPQQRTKKRERDFMRRKEGYEYVARIKESAPCKDCGHFFPAVAMDFDHLRDKIKSIATMVSAAYKLDLIKEEIAKCEVVCACCHRIRTASRRQNLAPTSKISDQKLFF